MSRTTNVLKLLLAVAVIILFLFATQSQRHIETAAYEIQTLNKACQEKQANIAKMRDAMEMQQQTASNWLLEAENKYKSVKRINTNL